MALAVILLTAYLHILLEKNAKTARICPAEGRQLTDRELVDTFLFGPEGRTMTNTEKTERLKKEKNGVYPDCCRITGRHSYGWFYDLISDLYGNYIFEIEMNFPQAVVDEKEYPYYESYYSVTPCGGGGNDFMGMPINEKYYKLYLELNKKYWKELENE